MVQNESLAKPFTASRRTSITLPSSNDAIPAAQPGTTTTLENLQKGTTWIESTMSKRSLNSSSPQIKQSTTMMSTPSAVSVLATTPVHYQTVGSSDSVSSSRRVKLRDRNRVSESIPQVQQESVCSLPPIHATQLAPSLTVSIVKESSAVSLPPIAGAAEPSSDKGMNKWSKQSSFQNMTDFATVQRSQFVISDAVELPFPVDEFGEGCGDFRVKIPHEEERVVEDENLCGMSEDVQARENIINDLGVESSAVHLDLARQTMVDEDQFIQDHMESEREKEMSSQENDEEGDQIIVHQDLAHLLSDESDILQRHPSCSIEDDGWRLKDEELQEAISNGDYYDVPSDPSSPHGPSPPLHLASFTLSDALAAHDDSTVMSMDSSASSRNTKGGVAFEVDWFDRMDAASLAPSGTRGTKIPATSSSFVASQNHVVDVSDSAVSPH